MNPVDTFISEVIRAEHLTLAQIAAHEAGRQSVKANFAAILRSCVDNLLANRAEFEAEAQEAFTLFRQWHDRGMFRL